MYLNNSKMEMMEGLCKYDLKSFFVIFISNIKGRFRNGIKLMLEPGAVRNKVKHIFCPLQPICNTPNVEMTLKYSYVHLVHNTLNLNPSDQQIANQY